MKLCRAIVGVVCLLAALVSVQAVSAQAQPAHSGYYQATSTPTPTATATPTPTSTAIPAVELGLSSIITTTRQLANDQVSAWYPSTDTGPLFLGLAALIFVFGLLMLVKATVSWRVRAADE
jgi:hypothetical protein